MTAAPAIGGLDYIPFHPMPHMAWYFVPKVLRRDGFARNATQRTRGIDKLEPAVTSSGMRGPHRCHERKKTNELPDSVNIAELRASLNDETTIGQADSGMQEGVASMDCYHRQGMETGGRNMGFGDAICRWKMTLFVGACDFELIVTDVFQELWRGSRMEPRNGGGLTLR